MKKSLKIAAFILALVLIIFLIYLADIFTGYPVSYFRVKNVLDTYMQEHYSETDFVTEKLTYSLKLGGFNADVYSPSSTDSNFSIGFYNDGTLKYDTYEMNVKTGMNTAMRLSSEYNDSARKIFDEAEFPFDALLSGELCIDHGFEAGLPGTKIENIIPEELEIDKNYNIAELSKEHGKLYLRVFSDDVNAETAAASLLKLYEIMDKAELPFKAVHLEICSNEKDENNNPEKTMQIINFGWDDILASGLDERIELAVKATEDYYNR